ncbi:MAG: hypothetical protein WDN47_01550 [Candidatus Doudnabacteria bacterium]
MENEKEQGNPEERASDVEMAMRLSKLIDNPGEVETAPGIVGNNRDLYIREAESLLPTMTNPEAKKVLENKINQYKK